MKSSLWSVYALSLGLDSINIEYSISVEREFGIEIFDEDLSLDLIDDLNMLANMWKIGRSRRYSP